MKALQLTTGGKKQVRKASRKKVEDYFTSVPATLKDIALLAAANRYRVECVSLYGSDSKATPRTVNHADIIDYVSASAPAHVIDAWSFLGRAIDGALRGDVYSAVHFGYYAELRAAMALLAAEGIGVFSNRHPVLDDSGITSNFHAVKKWNAGNSRWDPNPNSGTHEIVWPLLHHWSTLKRSVEVLDRVIQPENISLSKWLAATGKTVPTRAIGERWLKSWGIDLAIMDDDHSSRNLASYRPSEFRIPTDHDIKSVAEFVESLWKLFEPGSNSKFPTLERYLLRRALRAAGGAAPTSLQLVTAFGFDQMLADSWVTFLSLADDPSPFTLAEKASTIDQKDCHLQIISRAALLLSLATGASRRLFAQAGYDADTLAYWWKRHGIARGMWGPNSVPDDPLDTWQDILEVLNNSTDWRTANAANSPSLDEFRATQSKAICSLGGLELAAIWGLIP
jgi:hypothetical protein